MRELRKEKYDLVIDFQGLMRSGLISFFAKGGVKAGFASPREKSAALFYSKKLAVNMTQHAVPRYVELVNLLCSTTYGVPECPVSLSKDIVVSPAKFRFNSASFSSLL